MARAKRHYIPGHVWHTPVKQNKKRFNGVNIRSITLCILPFPCDVGIADCLFCLQKSSLDIADVSIYLKICGMVFDSEQGLKSDPGRRHFRGLHGNNHRPLATTVVML